MDIEKKKELLQMVIDEITNEVSSMAKSIESEHQAMKEAPGSNKTWSDTTRSQLENLLMGKTKMLADSKKALLAINNLKEKIRQTEVVQLGAVVATQSRAGKKETYLIVPGGGGKIMFENKEVILLSYSSPLSNALRGHKGGDCVKVQLPTGATRTLTILNVS